MTAAIGPGGLAFAWLRQKKRLPMEEKKRRRRAGGRVGFMRLDKQNREPALL